MPNWNVVVHYECVLSLIQSYGQVFEYKRLVQDNNRQVRENTHGAMADLTTNAGCVLSCISLSLGFYCGNIF